MSRRLEPARSQHMDWVGTAAFDTGATKRGIWSIAESALGESSRRYVVWAMEIGLNKHGAHIDLLLAPKDPTDQGPEDIIRRYRDHGPIPLIHRTVERPIDLYEFFEMFSTAHVNLRLGFIPEDAPIEIVTDIDDLRDVEDLLDEGRFDEP